MAGEEPREATWRHPLLWTIGAWLLVVVAIVGALAAFAVLAFSDVWSTLPN